MSIVPISLLSTADLSRLGNNLRPPPQRRARRPGAAATARADPPRFAVAAVNRSLAAHGERVARLDPPAPPQGPGRPDA